MPLILGSRSWQELCESRGGRPGLPVTNSPYGLCGRKATLSSNSGELMLFRKPFWFLVVKLCVCKRPMVSRR